MSRNAPPVLPNPGFVRGFRYAFQAIGTTLTTPSLLLLVLLALLINGALLGALVWWGWHQTDGLWLWLQQHAAQKGTWSWLAQVAVQAGPYVLGFLVALALYFVLPTLLSLLMNLNPLTAWLATQMFAITFRKRTGQKLPETLPFLSGLTTSLWAELRKIGSSVLWFILALSLNLIPVAGTVASTVLLLMIGAQFAGWSYITPYYEALGYNYVTQRAAMRSQRLTLWGLGVIALVPLLNLIALMTGPVGGALLAAEIHRSAPPPRQK